MAKKSVSLFSLIIFTVLSLSLICLPDSACADEWSLVAEGGMDGNYSLPQRVVPCIAQNGSDLFVGTGASMNWLGGGNVWTWNGSSWFKCGENDLGDENNDFIYSMASYKANLYAGTENTETGCQILRYDGDMSWTKVSEDGFGTDDNIRAKSMAVYEDALYVGTHNFMTGAEVWRYEGKNWTCVGKANSGCWNSNNYGIYSLSVYNEKLYAGTYNYIEGCEVWVYDGAKWKQSAEGGFGDISNTTVSSMASLAGSLYAGTFNEADGCEVWSFDGSNWNMVEEIGNGFGSENNIEALSLAAYEGGLIVGTQNTWMGSEIWRWDSSGISKIAENSFDESDDPIGPQLNQTLGVTSLFVYGNEMYCGTMGLAKGSLRKYAGGTDWPLMIPSGMTFNVNRSVQSLAVYNGKIAAGTSGDNLGGQVWLQDEYGKYWYQISENGFGNSKNNSINSLCQYGSSLYAGTSNDINGCSVWEYNGSSWKQVSQYGFGSHDDTILEVLCMVVFDDLLFVGTYGGGVWHYDGAYWTQVGTKELGDSVYSLCVYNGKLYAGTSENQKARVYRYAGGQNWIPVNEKGFGENNYASSSLCTVGEYMYAGTTNWNGCQVWRYDGAKWKKIATGGFGNECNEAIYDMKAVGSNLYAGISETVERSEGCEIWKFDGSDWSRESTPGFGDVFNEAVMSMATHGNSLYVGTKNDFSGCELWRTPVNGPQLISSSWCLAEGSNAWGFSTYIAVQNPNDNPVDVMVTYLTNEGPVQGGIFTMSPKSRSTIDTSLVVPDRDFSTVLSCLEEPISPGCESTSENASSRVPNVIAAERTMTWKYKDEKSQLRNEDSEILRKTAYSLTEGHSSIGVTCDSDIWFLPEGCSDYGFETWTLIQNKNDLPASVDITYMPEGGNPVTVERYIPPNTRQTFNMKDDIGKASASIMVQSNIPVVAERAMYMNDRRGGHCSVGTNSASVDYYLAEGSTAWGFNTWILIQNPNSESANIYVTYMTDEGTVEMDPIPMAANSRLNLNANSYIESKDISVHINADKPIIAERAMYWDNGTGEACHASIGFREPRGMFFFPDARSDEERETWLLVQNPNDTSITISITYMTETGNGNLTFFEEVAAGSRVSYNLSDRMPDTRASVKISCMTPEKKFMAEKAMYWDNRGAGTSTIGAFAD